MKMIEVFDLMAKKEIKHETLLIVYSESVREFLEDMEGKFKLIEVEE